MYRSFHIVILSFFFILAIIGIIFNKRYVHKVVTCDSSLSKEVLCSDISLNIGPYGELFFGKIIWSHPPRTRFIAFGGGLWTAVDPEYYMVYILYNMLYSTSSPLKHKVSNIFCIIQSQGKGKTIRNIYSTDKWHIHLVANKEFLSFVPIQFKDIKG